MGCTSGKMSQEYIKYESMLQKLLTSYQSVELYIQQQRERVYCYLSQNEDVQINLESVKERETLINLNYDVNLFRKYKKINKYKYEKIIVDFLKNIKYCTFKMQQILEMHSQFSLQLSQINISLKQEKYTIKKEELINRINDYNTLLCGYLLINKESSISNSNQLTMCQVSMKNDFNVQTETSVIEFI